MNKNRLILLFVLILSLIIGLIFISAKSNNIVLNKKDEISENFEKKVVTWNGNNAVIYDNYLYFVDKKKLEDGSAVNKICRISLSEDSKVEVLYNSNEFDIQSRLMIYDNNLFFNVLNEILYIDLSNTNYINEMGKGSLYYIADGKIIFLYQNKIYKGEYYTNTYKLKDTVSLATGNFNYMFEDDENLYFYTTNIDYSVSVLKVNKVKQYVNVLDRIYQQTKRNMAVLDFKNANNFIYLLIEKNISSVESEYLISKINKDGSKSELIPIEKLANGLEYIKNDDVYFRYNAKNGLLKYNSKTQNIENVDTDEKIKIFSLKEENSKLNLYQNDVILCSICDISGKNINNVNINEYENYIFVDFNILDENLKTSEYVLYMISKDATNIEKLN